MLIEDLIDRLFGFVERRIFRMHNAVIVRCRSSCANVSIYAVRRVEEVTAHKAVSISGKYESFLGVSPSLIRVAFNITSEAKSAQCSGNAEEGVR